MCDEHHRAPGGKSRRDVTTCFVAAVEEYRRQHRGENSVVVAHGVAIAYALADWVEGDSARLLNNRLDNTAVASIDLSRRKIDFIDRTDHL